LPDSVESAMTGAIGIAAIFTACPLVSASLLDNLGRKWTVSLGAAIFCAGVLVQLLVSSSTLTIIFRLLSGLGVGIMNASVPVYVAEIAAKEVRGLLGGLYQLGMTLGMFLGALVSYLLQEVASGWRYCLVPQVCLSGLLVFGMILLPESPRHALNKGDGARARASLERLRKGAAEDYIEAEFQACLAAVESSKQSGVARYMDFCNPYLFRLVLVGIAVVMFRQLSGFNSFLYYGPPVFAMAGINAYVFQMLQSGVNLLGTLVSLVLIDKMGRRALLISGGLGMAAFLVALAITGYLGIVIPKSCNCGIDRCPDSRAPATHCAHGPGLDPGAVNPGIGAGVVVAGLAYVLAYSLSFGPVPRLYCAEIFPMKYRSKGCGFTTMFTQFGNWLVATITPPLADNLSWGVYLFWGAWCLLAFVFATFLPETANVPMEEVRLLFETKFGVPLDAHPPAQSFRVGLSIARGSYVGPLPGVPSAGGSQYELSATVSGSSLAAGRFSTGKLSTPLNLVPEPDQNQTS